MDVFRSTLDSTDGQVTTVSRTSSPPPLELLTPPPVVAEYWCHTQVRVTKMKYVWTISNFSFCREEMGEVVKSSFFSCGPNDKLKWCLRINPKGLDEESREYLSLYLLLVNCGTKGEARAKFKFSILNAKREETKAMESQRAYRFVQGKDWGFKKFIRRDVLMDESSGLLPNDRLTILCEVSVVGETLSESGQVNNQPINVPECNLHEDIGSLLFKEILTDVTLVVVSKNTPTLIGKCTPDCSASHPHQYSNSSGHTLSSLNSITEHEIKYTGYESACEDEDDDNEGEIEQDDLEERDFEDDEDDDEQDENESEWDEETHSSCKSKQTDSNAEHRNQTDSSSQQQQNRLQQSEQGEAEAAAQRIPASCEPHVSSATMQSSLYPAHILSSSSTLSPVTTTNATPTKGILIPVASASPSPLSNSPVVVNAESLKQQTLGSSDIKLNNSLNSDWRLAPSSSSVICNQLCSNTDEVESKSDGSCDPSQRNSEAIWSTVKGSHRSLSRSVPSTSSILPSDSQSSTKLKHPALVNTDVVGSSSGSSSNMTSSTVCIQNSQPNSLTHSKETLEASEEPVEAETSGSSSRIRCGNRRRNASTTGNLNRSLRSRLGRDSSNLTITKAASTTSSLANPSSSTACPVGGINQTAKYCGMRPTINNTVVNSNSNSSVVLRQFEAHKAILAARSPVFAAMFEHSMEESRANRVEITDMEPDTVAEVLRYIYTGQVVGLDRLAHELLAAADKYQLERLKAMCEESLVENLSVENACNILGLADMYNAEQLKSHALEFIMLHAHDVCETEGYEQLVRRRPRLLNECFRSLASQQLPLRCWARKRPRQS